MNLRKSVMVAMAQRDMKQKDVADKIGISQGSMSQLMGQVSCTGATLVKLASAFGLKVSEFVALGEE